MKKEVAEISIGGWYQRTTLHLSEVYEFFIRGRSRLKLSKIKLKLFYHKLNFKSVKREFDELEYVKAVTGDGIEVYYYEDGLYLLKIKNPKSERDVARLRKYFEGAFIPSVSYIFSLGAPTPKILANIKEQHPVVISIFDANHSKYLVDEGRYGEVYSKISAKYMTVYKTQGFIFVVVSPTKKSFLNELIGMQVFFREFKDQLERYLDIHRKVWEDISKIKEREFLTGKDIPVFRQRLDSYQKTIRLISNRIGQMGTYAHTRASLSSRLHLDDELLTLFKFRFEDLFDTLSYIKELWAMTSDYVDSAIGVVIEAENKSARSSVRSIQIMATVGVIAGILGYLTKDSLPSISKNGIFYLVALLIIAFVINYVTKKVYSGRKYKLKFVERNVGV